MDLSIITPVNNSETFLDRQLFSILNSYKRMEVKAKIEHIIIIDASYDSSGKIVEKYVQEVGKLYLVKVVQHIRPKGTTFCRNLGLKLAKGDYLYQTDTTDEFLPNFFNIFFEEVDFLGGKKLFYFDFKVLHKDKELKKLVPNKKDLNNWSLKYGRNNSLLFFHRKSFLESQAFYTDQDLPNVGLSLFLDSITTDDMQIIDRKMILYYHRAKTYSKFLSEQKVTEMKNIFLFIKNNISTLTYSKLRAWVLEPFIKIIANYSKINKIDYDKNFETLKEVVPFNSKYFKPGSKLIKYKELIV